MKLLVCDMAGTTVKDDGRVARCFSRALRDFGVTDEAGIQTQMGRGKMTAIKALLGEVHAEACFARFREVLEADYKATPAEPIPGAKEVFLWAQKNGMGVALNTGFYSEVTDIILNQLGWFKSGVVGAVVCDDDVLQGRPAPYMIYKAMMVHEVHDVRDVIYVGDTRSDMMAGHNARVRVNIGVLTGDENTVSLSKAGAHAVLQSIALVPKLLT